MGAGSFAAGRGRAGFDPSYVGPPSQAKAYARAIAFDPLAKAYPQDEDGSQIAIHPVDQKVAMLLGIEDGTVASAKGIWQHLRASLTRLPASRQPDVALQEVRRVLAPMVSAGDVKILGVTVATPARGTVQILVTYKNLRTGVVMPALQLP